MIRRLLAFFYPVENAAESELERATMVVLGACIGFALSVISVVAFLVLGEHDQLPVNTLGMVYCLLCLVLLRWRRSVDLAVNFAATTMMLVFPINAVVLRDLSQLAWVALIPIVVLLIGQLRHAVAWFVLVSAVSPAVALWVMREPGALRHFTPESIVFRAFSFLVMVFALTLTFALVRQAAQRKLEEARDEATRANALKSEFLANFSHEIRTPLNGIIGTADLALSGTPSPEAQEQFLVIQRCGSNLLRTINDVLELSRIEAGRLELFPVPTELPKLLGEVVALFSARARARGLSLTLELGEGHPELVLVDDLRLRQVVQNLVGNAVKFTAQGGVKVTLERAEPRGDRVLVGIHVEDTGPGIAPEATGRLFQAFSQARVEVDRVEGTGLGLSLCKQFIELMGGTLSLRSEVGKGSTFTIHLVLPRSQAVVAPGVKAVTPSPKPEGLKVLVVDDNEINLRVACALLQRLGHAVLLARDGQASLEVIRQHQPDVVFMDCHMPGLDGLEVTRRLRAEGDARPVVALTASVYADDRARCEAAGMNFFVSKPVTIAALQSVLEQVRT